MKRLSTAVGPLKTVINKVDKTEGISEASKVQLMKMKAFTEENIGWLNTLLTPLNATKGVL